MRKIVAVFLLMLSSSLSGRAQRYTHGVAPMVSFGIEWGSTVSVFNSYHYNYLCEEGYRLDEVGTDWDFQLHEYALIFVGANVLNRGNVGIASGIEGVADRLMIPLLVRASYHPFGLASDGVFARVSAGPAFEFLGPGRTASIETLGGGYRVTLSRAVSLDFCANLEAVQTRSILHDPDTGNIISERDTRRNSIGYYALNLSIALVF